MSPPLIPQGAANLGWSIKKTPMQSTIVASHVSGREVRLRNWVQPLYQFELVYSGLASSAAYPGLGQDSLQQLMGLFISVAGQAGLFLFTDPTDNFGTGQAIGVGDATTTNFAFQRALFNYPPEQVGWVSFVAAVYWNGIAQVGNWTQINPTAAAPFPSVTFTSAPGAGVVVTADFNWQFVCRFSDDTLEFEQFMQDLWQSGSVKFQSVRNGWFA